MGLNKASQCLLVSDVEKSQDYYRDQLGFKIEGQFVERDGVSFLIKKADNQELIRKMDLWMHTYGWMM